MQAMIQVKYNNEPKPGKKMANIKTADGMTFFYYPDKMGFREGENVTIEYDEQQWGDKPVNVIRRIVPAVSPQAATRPVPGHNSNGHTNGNGSSKDELIFVTGVVGRAMGSGKYDASDIGLLTKAAKVAYHESFGDPEG